MKFHFGYVKREWACLLWQMHNILHVFLTAQTIKHEANIFLTSAPPCPPPQMLCSPSSCVTPSTTVMPCWCRTPSAVCWSEATRILSSCCIHLVAGPKMTMCLWTGGWSSTLPSWRRASWTRPAPLSPFFLHQWCMQDPQRWGVVDCSVSVSSLFNHSSSM